MSKNVPTFVHDGDHAVLIEDGMVFLFTYKDSGDGESSAWFTESWTLGRYEDHDGPLSLSRAMASATTRAMIVAHAKRMKENG
jgi:hypothetical protein